MKNITSGLMILILTISACGPISPERAADECEERARAATGPKGKISVGANSDGKAGAGIQIGVTSDYIYGRDPHQVYESCVRQKSGQGPIRPLEL